MALDNQNKQRIIDNDITDLANLKQRVPMTYETVERVSDPENAVIIDLRRRLAPSALEIAYALKSMREDALILREAKHFAGKDLAHGAVAYLFNAADTHQIEFPVGHNDETVSQEARVLHEGYVAHLGFLSSKGAITFLEEEGLYVAYGNNRIIQKTEAEHDEEGNPGIIAYRDSESQRILEKLTDCPKRLIAEV